MKLFTNDKELLQAGQKANMEWALVYEHETNDFVSVHAIAFCEEDFKECAKTSRMSAQRITVLLAADLYANTTGATTAY